ncbi:MAG: cation:proton antiporter, partial [Coriobacteriales bacterium]
TLAAGFALNLAQPSIALAAAFALGAALGPTDAAAVVALGKDVKLSPRQKALLSGEALINDASGVVCFQFAIAAAVTGTFSAADAGLTFLQLFFGGIAAGLAMGGALRALRGVLRVSGLANTTVTVVMDVVAPFILFMAAEALHVSGILSVVAGGLLINMGPSKANAASAKANIVSASVWEVIIFIINGVLFVMLGMQLPSGISPTWEDVRYPTAHLVWLILLITFVITAVRFAWVFALELATKPEHEVSAAATGTIVLSTSAAASAVPAVDPFAAPEERERLQHEAVAQQAAPAARSTLGQKARSALVTTLAGPKGAVTLSIIMSIPLTLSSGIAFPFRNMLIFLAAGVILCTLLLANFLLPLLAPNTESGEDRTQLKQVQIKILRQVVAQLREQRTPATEKATQVVIRRYRERIRRLRASETTPEATRQLRLEVLDLQQEAVHQAIVEGSVDKQAGQEFADRLKRMRKSVAGRRYVLGKLRILPRKAKTASSPGLREQVLYRGEGDLTQEQLDSLHALIGLTETKAIAFLEEQMASDDTERVNSAGLLLMEHRAALANFEDRYRQSTTTLFTAQIDPLTGLSGVMHAERNAENLRVKEVMAEGYRLELEKIQDAHEQGQLSRRAARDLREEVYLLQMDASDALD